MCCILSYFFLVYNMSSIIFNCLSYVLQSYLFFCCSVFFFFKQKTAYELRISDWSSDVCSSDLNYFERTRSASDTSSRPGSVVTTIDIYDPVSTGFAVLPYDLLPEQRNTQLGVYVQDQIRYADRVTLVVGGRHDRAVSETEGSPDKVDKAWTFKVGLIGELDWGISPYISYSEAFQPVAGLNRNGVPFIPTRGRQYDGGIKWQPQRGMLLTATYYDIVEANRPTNDPANPLDTYQTGEIKSKGFEFEAAMEMPGNFQLTAAYSYNDAEVTSSLYTYEVGERVNDVPQHMASAWGVKTVPRSEEH